MSNPTLKQSQTPGRNPWLPAPFISPSTPRFSLPSTAVFSRVSLSPALPHPAQKDYMLSPRQALSWLPLVPRMAYGMAQFMPDFLSSVSLSLFSALAV